MSIALSHGGPTVYANGKRSDELLVGTAKGITTLRRDGSGWRETGTTLPDQHISAILVDGDLHDFGRARDDEAEFFFVIELEAEQDAEAAPQR